MKINSTREGFVKGINENDKVKSGEEIETMGMDDPWSKWRNMH